MVFAVAFFWKDYRFWLKQDFDEAKLNKCRHLLYVAFDSPSACNSYLAVVFQAVIAKEQFVHATTTSSRS